MGDHRVDLEHAVESKWAKVVSTFLVPVLLTVIGTLGYMALTDIKSNQKDQGEKLEAQSMEMQSVKGDIRVMKATLDTGLVWRINELERRLNTVEQAQKTP